MTKPELHKQIPVNLCVADFKQPLPNNYAILMLDIIPNRKLHTVSFQMGYNDDDLMYGGYIKLNKNCIALAALLLVAVELNP